MAQTAYSAKVYSGKWKLMWFPKTASATLTAGVLVDLTSGYVAQAGTGSGGNGQPLVGIYGGATYASSDATTVLVPVYVPAEPHAYALITVGTGSLSATASFGQPYDVDANSNVTVSTSTHKCLTCVGYVSATQGIFKLESIHPIVA